MTITFIESHYPRDLLAYFRAEQNNQVVEIKPGIYSISGYKLPMQIINNRQLASEENLWLKDLDNRLTPMELHRINEAIGYQGKEARLKAYLDAIIRANIISLQEALNMNETELTLDKVLEEAGLIAKWMAQGEAQGIARGEARGEERKAIAIAKKLIDQGLSLEAVISATELDPATVKQLLKSVE